MRSIRYRLAGLFFAILLGAIAVIYLYVVPQLESSLRREKLNSLAQSAQSYSGPLLAAVGSNVSAARVNAAVRQAADASGDRVTLLGVSRGTLGLQTYPISDSTAEVNLEDLSFLPAQQAAESGRTRTGSESAHAGRLGEAARPLFFGGTVARVVVYSSPLSDVSRNVAVVRRQVLIAGALALLLGVLGGYLVARALARRVKRLEQAAEQVAAGDFSQTIPIDSDDELGQLARAFNEMQGQLAQLESARKRFIATASHELRTPIFSIGGFVELLSDEDLDDETRRQFLGLIREQVERLRKLATELLDLSKLEAGSLDLRPEPCDLGELARGVADEFLPRLANHDSRIELRLGAQTPEAQCDPERVAQIVRILIDNALTHTPAGTDIVVTATRDNGQVHVAVRDDGPGIKRAALPRIFEPFFTSDDARGSGLGLAIAHELAERMTGRLAVDSAPGHTVFTLELPA